MILSVDPSRALPVYEQVREQIRRMVAAGTLPPGDRLPTIRQLAADLGLAKGTIERAYEMLESDAVVERRGRNGTFVAKVTPATKQEMIRALETSAEHLAVTARQLGADEEAAVRALRAVWQRL